MGSQLILWLYYDPAKVNMVVGARASALRHALKKRLKI